MKAIVTGMVATYPVGGVLWDYAQYALGLERLGFEVTYLEDTGGETYDPRSGVYSADPSYAVAHLGAELTRLSARLGTNWHFRAADGSCYGLAPEALEQAIAEADLFLNVSGGTLLRNEYARVPLKILIDTDPGWNQFVNYPRWDENPGWQGSLGWRGHDSFFSYATRLGRTDCELPALGVSWLPTRPPVVTDLWQTEPPGELWTTVMTWNNFGEPIEGNGRSYGTKELEFPLIEALPGRTTGARFEIATGGSEPPVERWRKLGWSVVDAPSISVSAADYRSYLQRSRGEISVAKNVYVATRSGWFSCRTVCYLAAGRPAVIQDTGFSQELPTGAGLIAFSDADEALAGIEQVQSSYDTHARAAREIACERFEAERVIEELLERAGFGR